MECTLGNGRRLKFWSDRWIQRRRVSQIAPALMQFVKPAALKYLVAEILPDGRWVYDLLGTSSITAISELFNLWNILLTFELSDDADSF